MKIVPPYNNGVDPEIRETDLPRPMKFGEWLRMQQQRTELSAGQKALYTSAKSGRAA